MSRMVCAVLLLSLVGCSVAPRPAEPHLAPYAASPLTAADLARSDVRTCFSRLVPWSGARAGERAAFLTLHDGRFTCVMWAPSMTEREARWSGPMPAGTAALVHTHPRAQPLPSDHDATEAQRIGVPVLVVTPSGVTAAPADGGATVKFAGSDYWSRRRT